MFTNTSWVLYICVLFSCKWWMVDRKPNRLFSLISNQLCSADCLIHLDQYSTLNIVYWYPIHFRSSLYNSYDIICDLFYPPTCLHIWICKMIRYNSNNVLFLIFTSNNGYDTSYSMWSRKMQQFHWRSTKRYQYQLSFVN